MVTVGFVVEGPSDEMLVNSKSFRDWLREDCGLVVSSTVNAGGNGQMCSSEITAFVRRLRRTANPDRVVVLADLDPELCAPCITKRKERIGQESIDLILIARKAMESWFLADTEAMRRWTGDHVFREPRPEAPPGMPRDRLKEIGRHTGRGPGGKIRFARKFIRDHGFDVRRAAEHPACPSARYFVERLCALGTD